MKTLLFLFIIYTVQLLAAANNDELSNQLAKNKPVKGILVNRKYYKSLLRSKKAFGQTDYTVFPLPYNKGKERANIPESLLFPFEVQKEQESKHRVKKVLPDLYGSVKRVRRSPGASPAAVGADAADTSTAKAESTATTEEVPKEKSPTAKPEISTEPAKTDTTASKTSQSSKAPAKSKTGTALKKSVGKRRNAKTTKRKTSAKKGRSVRKGKSVAKNSSGTANKKKKVKSKSAKSNAKKGKKVKAGRRLIAAQEATIEQYPYVVSIQKNGEHWCSGALLNQRLIITTANCLWKSSSISRLRIRACSRHVDSGGQTAKIMEVVKHPGWSLRKNPDNDVALALLDRFIRFSHSCHAVDLPNRVMMPPFDDAWITSWGSERRDGIYNAGDSLSLQGYHARLINIEKCNNITKRYGVEVTKNFICFSQSGSRAPCTRDTGAPAVSDGVLWGLASWGIRKLCGTKRFPAMFSYTASDSSMDFISNATSYLMSEQRQSPFGDRYEPPMRQLPKALRSEDNETDAFS